MFLIEGDVNILIFFKKQIKNEYPLLIGCNGASRHWGNVLSLYYRITPVQG